jgi:ABC-type lipoprotein release transport system permease subunit
MELFITAWRNISRNRRRTALNIISLTVGIAILIITVGWIRGYFTSLYRGMREFDTGDLQVLNESWLEKEQMLPLDLLVEDYREIADMAESLPWVGQAAGRIDFSLRVGNGRDSMPVMGRAVDPEAEAEITVVARYVENGSWLEQEDEGVVLGEGVARKLGVAVGDTVYLRVHDRYSAPNLLAVPVRGLFRLGYPLMDESLIICSLSAAEDFLRTDGGVTRLVIATDGTISPEKAAAELNLLLPPSLQAYGWKRFAETMVAAVRADSGGFFLLMAILTLLIFLNILNSMSMTVRERGREIGTMRAIGMRRDELKKLLFFESLTLALMAAFFGLIISGAAAFYLQRYGIDFTAAMPEDMPIPFGERFYADYRWYDFAGGVLFACFTALAGTLAPAARAAKMSVVQTMRTGNL